VYALQDMTLCQLCKKTYTCPDTDYCEAQAVCEECGILCCAACNSFCDGFGGCNKRFCVNCSVECTGCNTRCNTCISKPVVYSNGEVHNHKFLSKEDIIEHSHARYNIFFAGFRKRDEKQNTYTVKNIQQYLNYFIVDAVKQRKRENETFIEAFEKFIGYDLKNLSLIRECCICKKLCFKYDHVQCFGNHVSVCIQCEPILEKKFPCSECQGGLFCEQCIKDPYEECSTEALWICSYLECENKVCLSCATRCPKCDGCICSSHGREEHSWDCEEEFSDSKESQDLNPPLKQIKKE